MKFFDAHTHANLAAFKEDYKETVNRALEKGVGLVNVGVDKPTSLLALEMAHEFENELVFAAIGLHPTDADEGDFDYEYYKKLALDSKTVAIGECGLDYYRVTSDKIRETKEKQKEIFIKQIELAHEVNKPLMIHCREAFSDLIDALVSYRASLISPISGIVHFFSGTKEEAKKLLDLGFYFTFGGVITFIRDYDEVIKFIPIERILSETDAPFVAPVPYRGKRNEPAYVVEVVKKLAELKSMSIELMAEQILKNTQRAFRIEVS